MTKKNVTLEFCCCCFFFVKIHSRCNTFVVGMELLFWSACVRKQQTGDSYQTMRWFLQKPMQQVYIMCPYIHYVADGSELSAHNRIQCKQSRDERVSLTRFFAVFFSFLLWLLLLSLLLVSFYCVWVWVSALFSRLSLFFIVHIIVCL